MVTGEKFVEFQAIHLSFTQQCSFTPQLAKVFSRQIPEFTEVFSLPPFCKGTIAKLYLRLGNVFDPVY